MYNHDPVAVLYPEELNLDGLGRGDLVDIESHRGWGFPSRWPLIFFFLFWTCLSKLCFNVLAVSSIPSAIKKGTTFLCEIGYWLLQRIGIIPEQQSLLSVISDNAWQQRMVNYYAYCPSGNRNSEHSRVQSSETSRGERTLNFKIWYSRYRLQ